MSGDRFKSRRKILSVKLDPLDLGDDNGWSDYSPEEFSRICRHAASLGAPVFGVQLILESGLATPVMLSYGGCVPRVGEIFEQGGRNWEVSEVRHQVREDGEALNFIPVIFAVPR